MSSNGKNESKGGVPKRRETLTERFERIMGFSFESVAEEPPQKDSSRRTKSSSKRRDQILQAQRSHRQRTQLYIRELEKEVVRLRSLEKTANAKLAKRSTPSVHDIEQSSDYSDWTDAAGSPASTTSSNVKVDLTALASAKPEPPCDIGPVFAQPPTYKPGPTTQNSPAARGVAESTPAALDSQSAVDFVLALERPCLGHVKFSYLAGSSELDSMPAMYENYGMAHTFNISSSLIQSSYAKDPASTPFEVPTFDIDNLLAASHNLGLSENEITPVQIWASLKNMSRSRVITRDQLAVLTAELFRYSRCNGFGTVIDKNIVDSVFAVVFT